MDIFFIGYDAIGDFISNNGMIRYLLKRYEKVLVVTDSLDSFLLSLFNDNKNVVPVNFHYYNSTIDSNKEIDVIDVRVHEKYQKSQNHNGNYFDKDNKIGNVLNQNDNDNASSFYSNMGLPIEMRISEFYFKRDIEQEKNLLESLSLNNGFTSICDYHPCLINKNYVNNTNIVNLHKISPRFTDIISIIENSNEVHLIENSISLFIYHLQSKGLMKKVNIKLHAYCRKESHRICNGPNCNNLYLNMLLSPKLENWDIIWS